MARIPFSKSDWTLVHPEQDVRGWEVRGAREQKLGRVQELIVNTASGYVDAVVLEDGTEYPADDLFTGNGVVYLEQEKTTRDVRPLAVVYDDYGRVTRTERLDVQEHPADAYEEAYRTHHASTFADMGAGYEDYVPAYRFGYEMARDPRYHGKPYEEAVPELTAAYRKRHPNSLFEQVQEAVRHAYDRERSRRS